MVHVSVSILLIVLFVGVDISWSKRTRYEKVHSRERERADSYERGRVAGHFETSDASDGEAIAGTKSLLDERHTNVDGSHRPRSWGSTLKMLGALGLLYGAGLSGDVTGADASSLQTHIPAQEYHPAPLVPGLQDFHTNESGPTAMGLPYYDASNLIDLPYAWNDSNALDISGLPNKSEGLLDKTRGFPDKSGHHVVSSVTRKAFGTLKNIAADDDARDIFQGLRFGGERPDVFLFGTRVEIGMRASVAEDESTVWRECEFTKLIQLSPVCKSASIGRLIGKTGKITEVDFHDGTAKIDNDIGWVPVGALDLPRSGHRSRKRDQGHTSKVNNAILTGKSTSHEYLGEFERVFQKKMSVATELHFKHPTAKLTVLYLITSKVGNESGAFDFSNERVGSSMAKRMLHMANHYNVVFKLVSSQSEAVGFVKSKVKGSLKHVVIGGHGGSKGVLLGEWLTENRVGADYDSKALLRALRPHLMLEGDVRSTVLLDSCKTGKQRDGLAAAQRIAMELPGAEVLGWDITINDITVDENFVDIPHFKGESKGVRPRTFMYKNDWVINGASLLEKPVVNKLGWSRQDCAEACAEDPSCPGFSFEMLGLVFDWSYGKCLFLVD